MLEDRQREKSKYEKIYGEDLRYENTGQLYGSLCHGHKVQSFIEGLDFNTVLDIGCGRGQWATILRDLGKEVSATDISEALISKLEIEGVKLYSSPMWDLPLEDNTFDLVTSFEVLEHIPESELDQSLKEANRVSKNGVVVSVAWHEDHKFGMDLHVTLRKKDWWLAKFSDHFASQTILREDAHGMFLYLEKAC